MYFCMVIPHCPIISPDFLLYTPHNPKPYSLYRCSCFCIHVIVSSSLNAPLIPYIAHMIFLIKKRYRNKTENPEVCGLQDFASVCPFGWWEQRESNPRPSACKADALNQLSYAPFFHCVGLRIISRLFTSVNSLLLRLPALYWHKNKLQKTVVYF